MIIGIGIIAYNRPKNYYRCVKSIFKTIDFQSYNYKIICSLDTNENSLVEEFKNINKEFNVKMIYHKNCGISLNKSIALHALKDCDHIFLIEEDIEFTKSGWVDLFLKAHNRSKYGLLNTVHLFSEEEYKKSFVKSINYEDISITYYDKHTAQIMSITKETFDKVGYLNPKFLCYGFEHCEYTYRCGLVNLCPIGIYPTISNLSDYISHQNCEASINRKYIKNIFEYNCNLYITTVILKQPIYISYQQIQSYLPIIYHT